MPDTKSYKISSGYGNRTDPYGKGKGGNEFHHGVDIATPKGTALGATVRGTVVYAGYGQKGSGYGGYGYAVAIRDHAGNVHVYGHLDSVSVKKGQTVKAGQLVGKTGNSGNSTGAHLHYEVRKGGQLKNTLNPMDYLQ